MVRFSRRSELALGCEATVVRSELSLVMVGVVWELLLLTRARTVMICWLRREKRSSLSLSSRGGSE